MKVKPPDYDEGGEGKSEDYVELKELEAYGANNGSNSRRMSCPRNLQLVQAHGDDEITQKISDGKLQRRYFAYSSGDLLHY